MHRCIDAGSWGSLPRHSNQSRLRFGGPDTRNISLALFTAPVPRLVGKEHAGPLQPHLFQPLWEDRVPV